MSIASGHADTGLGARPAATALNLEFVPVIWEEFDIVLTGDALTAAERPRLGETLHPDDPKPPSRTRSAATGSMRAAVEHVVCIDGHPEGTATLAELKAGGDPGSGFEACWRAVAPGDLLTLVYTSGTTGPPKGVEITHGQVLAGLLAASAIMAAGPGDRVVSYLPMAHIAERYFSHYSGVFTGLQAAPVADITVRVHDCVPVTASEFEAARQRGWQAA